MLLKKMPTFPGKVIFPAAVIAGSLLAAQAASAQTIGDIFVIDMENHNFTQPGTYTNTQALLNNPAALYETSLITPGNVNAAQTSYAINYHNVASGIHPSEPNYLWQEAGTNFGVLTDNPPYGSGGNNQNTTQHLTGLLQSAGISWKSYQEDSNINPATGAVLPQNQWTVPLNPVSGSYSGTIVNAYNGSQQYDFEPKHDGSLYFTDTNGGNNATTSNPEISHYAPLQQLTSDLNTSSVARYNLITPDLFNDAHSALPGGFTYHGTHYTGDAAEIAQGDNFLSQIIPQIQASAAYKNNGMIDIWWDETEGGDTSAYTLSNIVLSPLAKGNAYQSTRGYTHSSDLKTYQEILGVRASGGGFLGDANTPATSDFSDEFRTGIILSAPEPSPFIGLGFFAVGLAGILLKARRQAA